MTERYSPAEAKLALTRVAELQAAREREVVGCTREELAKISEDAGLDADLLDRALAEVAASRATYRVERGVHALVVSCELTRHLGEDEREELSNRLCHEYGVQGRWTPISSGGQQWLAPSLQLTVRPTTRGDLLRLVVRPRWPTFAMLLGVPAASGAIGLTVATLFSWRWGIEPIAWAVFLASLVIGWVSVFLVRTRGSGSGLRSGEQLVALLEQIVRRVPSEPSPGEPSPGNLSNSKPPRALREGD